MLEHCKKLIEKIYCEMSEKHTKIFLKDDILLRRRGNRKETILNRIYLCMTWTNDSKGIYWYNMYR